VFRHCAIHAWRRPSGISKVQIGRAGTSAISALAGTPPVTIDPAAMMVGGGKNEKDYRILMLALLISPALSQAPEPASGSVYNCVPIWQRI
jgi:hypothetical protein